MEFPSSAILSISPSRSSINSIEYSRAFLRIPPITHTSLSFTPSTFKILRTFSIEKMDYYRTGSTLLSIAPAHKSTHEISTHEKAKLSLGSNVNLHEFLPFLSPIVEIRKDSASNGSDIEHSRISETLMDLKSDIVDTPIVELPHLATKKIRRFLQKELDEMENLYVSCSKNEFTALAFKFNTDESQIKVRI